MSQARRQLDGIRVHPFTSPEQIYKEIYGSNDISTIEDSLKSINVGSGICGKELQDKEFAWECPVCGEADRAIMCDECFQASDHIGHNAKKIRISGGICDCGDSDVWNIKGACPKHAQGYCNETEINIDLLPEPIRKVLYDKLNLVISRLTQCCLLLEDMKSGVITERQIELQEEIGVIIRALGHLAKGVNPIFLHLIALKLCSHSINHKTKHACHARAFENEEERNKFSILCTKEAIDPKTCRIAGTLHTCTCTHIENLLRILYNLGTEGVVKAIKQLLSPLQANRRMKFYMGIAYFANYPSIIPHCANETEELAVLSVQFIAYDDVVRGIVGNEYYLGKLNLELERIIGNLEEYLQTSKSAVRYGLTVIRNDLSMIIKEEHSDIYYKFLLSFIKKLAMFQQFETYLHITKGSSLLLIAAEIEKILEDIFVKLLGIVNMNDMSQCKDIAKRFKEVVINCKLSPKPDSSIFLTIMYRCLSIFLINSLLHQYWLRSTEETIKVTMYQLFEFESESACQLFIEQILKRLLRFIGFLCEVNTGKWIKYGIIPRFFKLNPHYEFSLIGALLPLYDKADLFKWIIKAMYGNDSIWKCIELICNSEVFTSNEENWQEVLEYSLHTICSLMSNDIAYFVPFYVLRNMNKNIANGYIEYTMIRQVVLTYMKKADGAGIKIADIKEDFPESLCDLDCIEKCLEHISTPFMNDLNREVKFKLNDEYFKYYDPFMQYVKALTNDEFQYSLKVMKNMKDPRKFDVVFGELALEKKDCCSEDTKEPYVPFKFLLRERFSRSEIPKLMVKLLNSTKSGIITSWMIRCALKVLLCCSQFSELKKYFAINISRALIKKEENIIESYKEIFTNNDLFDEKTKDGEFMSSKTRERIHRYKSKVLEEYKRKIKAFQSKNKTILHDIEKWDPAQIIYICGYCRHSVNHKTYINEPYGKIVYLHKSKVYGRHLNQLLKKVKHKIWKSDSELRGIPGVTEGVTLTSCGHYIHEDCWQQILKKPPKNDVTVIDSKYTPKNFLCPLCRVCGNNILIPHEVLTNFKAVKEMRLLLEMKGDNKQVNDVQELYKIICEYITYQLHMIDLKDIADFAIKEDCIKTLIQCLKLLIEDNYYNELINIKEQIEHNMSFLTSNLSYLFEVDLISLFIQIIVGAKLLESKNSKTYKELIDKCEAIIKLAIIQISFSIVFANSSFNPSNCKTFLQNLNVLLKDRKRIEKRLYPFLKKLVCAKHLLFPKGNTKENIVKAGWVAEPHEITFYFKALNINHNLIQSLLHDTKPTQKASFIHLPYVNNKWMYSCFSELFKNLHINMNWPLMIIYKAGIKKFELTHLPENLNTLLSYCKKRTCNTCHTYTNDSAICLLCGDLLCAAGACCQRNSVGELTWHAEECENGCGLYLRLRGNKVIILDKGQARAYQSPYIGNLKEEVLESRIVEELKELYLSHNIPQRTRIIALKSVIRFTPFSL